MTLIALEGIDGAGTTTQARRLAGALATDGWPVHLTRQPSDGPIGRLLRDLLAGAHAPVDRVTMALLFAADRADHLHREVTPALARGAVVISDRWYHSSLAYQGGADARDWVRTINRHARAPDLTIFLEVRPEVAAARRAAAGRAEELYDRLDTQRQIAANYRDVLAELDGERIEIVDGEQPPDAVAARVVELARAVCGRRRSA
ncbi:MAG: dTMP kinase [Deltaproteobacteria bacterium]|nr:MAG: dTMP kinase [Deltaproteobacteria bacterium]